MVAYSTNTAIVSGLWKDRQAILAFCDLEPMMTTSRSALRWLFLNLIFLPSGKRRPIPVGVFFRQTSEG